MSKLLRLLFLLAAAAPALSQGENEPYFALSNAATYASNGKPRVSMSAWNVDSLEFRVYRVEDPLKFFEQLEDPHQFGGRVQAPPRRPTILERVHFWKRELRADIRRSLRGQFTESPSDRLGLREKESAAPSTPVAKGTHYAEAPLLNSQQLVLQFVQPVRAHTRWDREMVDIGVKDKGVYLVEAVRGDLRAYTILMVTDIAMITKTGKGRVVNLLVDRASGQPLAGVKIATLARDQRLQEVETNADGIAEIPLPPGRPESLRLVAHRGRDVAVNALQEYSFGANAEQWMGYIYTDRPVYRPGHTVHFKGILRLGSGGGYVIPAGRQVSVTINDPEQKPVYQKTLNTTANGAIHDEFTLAAGAALGGYFMEVKSGDGMMNGNFDVEEYKKPEYEVRVTPSKTRVIEGETLQATIDARYYFGEPVSGAKVKYAVYRERYWFPMWYEPDDDNEAMQQDGNDDDAGDQMNETEGQLDADGKLTIPIETTVSAHKQDWRYRIEARVTDQGNREIVGKGWVIATYGSFAVDVQPERYFYAPGITVQFTAQARDYESKPVKTHARVELLEWNWRAPDQSEVKASTELDIAADGAGKGSLALPSQGGSYRLRVTARTPEGRDVEGVSYIYVSGRARAGDEFRRNNQVQIIPDKKSYRAGDTVKLLIVTEKADTPVLVSIEGRDLRQYKLLRSKDATAEFEVPVTVTDEPGINVSAVYIRDGNLHMGNKYVKVPPLEHQLDVKLSTDKQQYLPGQSAEYRIDVTGSDGKPAPRAEFSLGVVDEAIYAIHRDTTQDIVRFFFDRDWNRVSTEESLNYYFNGEAGKRRMRLAEMRPMSRLAQLKPERMVEPKIRKLFPDTAYWAADLTTDAAGHARTKVDFPDSLTTWRATARGVTPDTKVGSATLKTIVRKNLIVRLVVPRFFVQGDEVVISALVHNYLSEGKKARVSLDVTGLDVMEGAARDVEIPSRGEAKLDWRVRAQQVRGATVLAKALTNEESDALQLELPVNIPGIRMSQSKGGALSAGATAAFDLAFPQKVQSGSRSISIRVTPSIAGSLFSAVEYLTAFPYGCVEQTMSSFLPNITVAKAVRELGIKADLESAELPQKIRAGLDRLYSFQHEDGGWGWWETDESHPFMTAYVVAGLVQARDAGTQVNQEAIDRGAAWTKKAFAQDSRLAYDLRAYMMYALAVAGQADAAGLGAVYDKRSNLSPYGLALLGLAMEQAKDGRASEIAAALERGVQQDQAEASWTATRDQMLDFDIDATPEATAFAVKFLSHQKPDSPLLPKAALWLMNHRNEGFWWSSTKQTAMVIYGLTDYLKATNELNPNFTATVFVNDRAVLTKKFDAAAGIAQTELVLDESKVDPAVNHVRVTMSGEGRLYYSARAEYFSTDDKLQKTGTVSLNLLRDYFRLTQSRDGERIVYDTTPLNGPVAVGDLIAVRLTVTGSEWKYVMIEDPIPAGTEFISRDNGYQLRNKPPWWAYFFTRRELHDDRMAIFQTYMPRGQHEYFYLLKVVNPGMFQVSPARVGPMYQSDTMATSEARRLEVK